MVVTPEQIIAAINPDLYSTNSSEVKKLVRKEGILVAAEKAKPIAIQYSTNDDYTLSIKVPSSGEGIEAIHTLVYDSAAENMEPLYFWLLDLIDDFGFKTEKLIDNFASSPGSGHFSEMGGRATAMQDRGSKLMTDIGILTKSVLNILYDLRDFNIRLQSYTDLKSSKDTTKEAARQSLKQVWLDKVDVLRGAGSIHQMSTGNLNFVTLRDAFLTVNNEDDVKKLDLSERVKRVLLPRVYEFNIWLKESEAELRKRYQIQRTWLKSQVNNLKLYSRWAKPYLKAAFDLQQKDMGNSADLVNAFNTIIFELTVLAKRPIKPKDAAISGELPKELTNDRLLKSLKRDYYSVILLNFKFRGIPQRISQQSHYAFGGKTEVSFAGYALNEDEIDKLKKELDKSDVNDMLKLVEGVAGENLEQMQNDIDFFLNEEEEEVKQKKARAESSNVNPFMALIGKYDREEATTKKKKTTKEEKEIKLKPDNFIEKTQLRPYAALGAADTAFKFFDIYKKAHQMPSYT